MGSNAGTGWPLTFRCMRCKTGREYRLDAPGYDSRCGTNVVRTGCTKPYKGGNQGVRGLRTFHEYACNDCGHVGWSRHVDIASKPLR